MGFFNFGKPKPSSAGEERIRKAVEKRDKAERDWKKKTSQFASMAKKQQRKERAEEMRGRKALVHIVTAEQKRDVKAFKAEQKRRKAEEKERRTEEAHQKFLAKTERKTEKWEAAARARRAKVIASRAMKSGGRLPPLPRIRIPIRKKSQGRPLTRNKRITLL